VRGSGLPVRRGSEVGNAGPIPGPIPERASAAEGTKIFVARNGRQVGSVVVADQLRPGSASAVKALQDIKIDVVLLTGDTRQTAQAVASELGIRNVHAELLPEQKTSYIAEQVREVRVVAMRGDGINDAPALSQATVGVAMGAETDVVRESADVVLIGNDLDKFVETVRVARNCRRIILENFYGTLVVDTISIGLAAAGYLNPLTGDLHSRRV